VSHVPVRAHRWELRTSRAASWPSMPLPNTWLVSAGGSVTGLDGTHTGSCSANARSARPGHPHGRCAPCRSRRQLCFARSVLLELGTNAGRFSRPTKQMRAVDTVCQGARSIVLLAAGALLEIRGASIVQSKIGWPPIRRPCRLFTGSRSRARVWIWRRKDGYHQRLAALPRAAGPFVALHVTPGEVPWPL
jgi:hypothetical protein